MGSSSWWVVLGSNSEVCMGAGNIVTASFVLKVISNKKNIREITVNCLNCVEETGQ